MRGHEIIQSISWSGDVHPDTVKQIQDAIEALDRRAHGTNRPVYNAMEAHKRLSAFIRENGGYRKAAEALGISKSFLYDMHNGDRPITDSVLSALGLMRTKREIYVPID